MIIQHLVYLKVQNIENINSKISRASILKYREYTRNSFRNKPIRGLALNFAAQIELFTVLPKWSVGRNIVQLFIKPSNILYNTLHLVHHIVP